PYTTLFRSVLIRYPCRQVFAEFLARHIQRIHADVQNVGAADIAVWVHDNAGFVIVARLGNHSLNSAMALTMARMSSIASIAPMAPALVVRNASSQSKNSIMFILPNLHFLLCRLAPLAVGHPSFATSEEHSHDTECQRLNQSSGVHS